MKMEAIDFIQFAFNNLGMNIGEVNTNQEQRMIIAKAHLAKCKLEMLNTSLNDCFLKIDTLTRNNLEITNPNLQNSTEKWYGYYIPYDFIRIANSNDRVVRKGKNIFSPKENGLQLEYIYDIPYNEIDGNAQSVLINLLSISLAKAYSISDANLTNELNYNLEQSKLNSEYDNNNKNFFSLTKDKVRRW